MFIFHKYLSPSPTAQFARGFSMIEVLVSVLVLSIGLLGTALMQNTSIRFNQDAYLRSAAVHQLLNMADRMRSNPQAATSGYYDFTSGMPASNPNCSPCTRQQEAQTDAYLWNADNATFLPAGTGTIALNGTRYTITVKWDRRKVTTAGAVCGTDPDVNLTCISLDVTP